MLGIRLEPELEKRLERLAKQTGRSKSYYAKLAIRQYLEDREDYLLGIAALERKEPRVSLEELEREMAWKVEFQRSAAKQLRALDGPTQRRILRFFRERVAMSDDPRKLGKALTGDKGGLWRYRIGDYRAICKLEDERLTVLVLEVGHRREIYR